MSAGDLSPSLGLGDAEQAWEILSQCVEELIDAWESGLGTPLLSDFLPAEPPALRRMALVELIKVDLEYRWRHRDQPKHIEGYVEDFPDLDQQGGIPADLIYEEYHIRRQAGEEVDSQEYFERFPQRASELARLLGLETPTETTALFGTDKMPTVEVGDKIEDFELLAQLGKGAFATVFLARQTSMQRLVALKISSDRGTEPQTMAQLDHANIVRVYDQRIDHERKARLLYMQYIAGGTLQEAINLSRKLPPTERSGKVILTAVDMALDRRGESAPADSPTRNRLQRASWPVVVCWIGSRLASALQYAHDRGVVHRDLKPANVLLASDATPKLVDFNISFSSTVEGASPGAYFGGSLAYMSPEHLEACNPNNPRTPEELDAAACDTYSLAVMIWEMLTGKRPFLDEQLGQSWAETLESMAQRRYDKVPAESIEMLPDDCPESLKELLLRCLEPDPRHRAGTARMVGRQLEICLQADVQRLVRPARRTWRGRIRNAPLLPLMLAAILPNAFGSALNITYNLGQIIEQLGETARHVFQNRLLTVLNVSIYSVGIAVCIGFAWAVLRGAQKARAGQPLEPEVAAKLRRRSLAIGDCVAMTSLALWTASGIAFPVALWDHFREQQMLAVQFLGTQILCGMMFGSIAFFLVTFLSVRSLYPALLSFDQAAGGDTDALLRLHWRTWIYMAAPVVVPFLSVIVLVALESELREAFYALSLIGVFGFGLALWVGRAIQRDLYALNAAVEPGDERFISTTTSGDSFWAGTR